MTIIHVMIMLKDSNRIKKKKEINKDRSESGKNQDMKKFDYLILVCN